MPKLLHCAHRARSAYADEADDLAPVMEVDEDSAETYTAFTDDERVRLVTRSRAVE